MIETVSGWIYAKYRLVIALFAAAFIAIGLATFTGFGQGALWQRTQPASDGAIGSEVAAARDVFTQVRSGQRTISALIEGVPLQSQSDFEKASQAFSPIRGQLAGKTALIPRKTLLDPFSLDDQATENPLLAKDRTAFIVLGLPAGSQGVSDATLLTAFRQIEPQLRSTFPTASVSIDSTYAAHAAARASTAKASIIIILVSALATLVAVRLATGRTARAIAGMLAVIAAHVFALFCAWVATFLVDLPTSLTSSLSLGTAVAAGITTAIFNALLSRMLRTSPRLTPQSLATGLSKFAPLTLSAIAASLVVLALMFLPRLNHLTGMAALLIPAVAGTWIIQLVVAPCLVLAFERFSKPDRVSHSPALEKLQSRLEAEVQRGYLATPLAVNKAAPAVAALVLLIGILPWTAISPYAARSAELANARETVHFRQVSESAFPALVEPAFSVLAETSPTNLTKWAQKLTEGNSLIETAGPAAPVGNDYAGIAINFTEPQVKFGVRLKTLRALQQPTDTVKPIVYSDAARNIEVTSAVIGGAPIMLVITAIVAVAGFFLLSGNWLWALIQTAFGAASVAAAVGITGGLFKLGLMHALTGGSVETRVDIGGVILGALFSIAVLAVSQVEPLYDSKPSASRTVWFITGASALAATLTGFIQLSTAGTILLCAILIGIMNSLLVTPQLIRLRSTSPRLASVNPRVNQLHERTRAAARRTRAKLHRRSTPKRTRRRDPAE